MAVWAEFKPKLREAGVAEEEWVPLAEALAVLGHEIRHLLGPKGLTGLGTLRTLDTSGLDLGTFAGAKPKAWTPKDEVHEARDATEPQSKAKDNRLFQP